MTKANISIWGYKPKGIDFQEDINEALRLGKLLARNPKSARDPVVIWIEKIKHRCEKAITEGKKQGLPEYPELLFTLKKDFIKSA